MLNCVELGEGFRGESYKGYVKVDIRISWMLQKERDTDYSQELSKYQCDGYLSRV